MYGCRHVYDVCLFSLLWFLCCVLCGIGVAIEISFVSGQGIAIKRVGEPGKRHKRNSNQGFGITGHGGYVLI